MTSTTRSPCWGARPELASSALTSSSPRSGLAARRVGSWAGTGAAPAPGSVQHVRFLMESASARPRQRLLLHGRRGGRAEDRLPARQSLDRGAHRAHPPRGHEVGFHAETDTIATPTARRASSACGPPPGARASSRTSWGGRQHYLRWEEPVDLADMGRGRPRLRRHPRVRRARGFRTGTCHELAAFDLRGRRPMRLRERPFDGHGHDARHMDELRPTAPRSGARDRGGVPAPPGAFSFLCHNSDLLSAKRRSATRGFVQARTTVR